MTAAAAGAGGLGSLAPDAASPIPGIQECMWEAQPIAGLPAVAPDSVAGGKLGLLRERLVDGIVSAVGSLQGARAGCPLSSRARGGMEMARAQGEFRSRCGEVLRQLGPVPEPQTRGQALSALLKQPDVYRLTSVGGCTVKPYCADKVRIVREGSVHPKKLSAVIGPDGAKFVAEPGRWIWRSLRDLAKLEDDELVQPYVDPALRNPKTMNGLVKKLFEAGVVTFRRKCRCKVGLFFVVKKDGMLRMVVDCRLANQLHHLPPYADLATASALSQLDFSDTFLNSEAFKELGKPLDIHFSSLDLTDGFYQFEFEEASSFFCLDHLVQAGDFGVTSIYDDDVKDFTPVLASEWLYPCFRVIPMGWSWSLFFCQSALTHAMIVSEAGRINRSYDDVSKQVVRDKQPVSRLGPARVLIAPYVDNANLIAWDWADAAGSFDALLVYLEAKGFVTRDHVRAAQSMIAIGLVFLGPERLLCNKSERVWRAHFAIRQLLRIGKASGRTLQVVVGHLVSLFLLKRCLLSCLAEVWSFIEEFLEVEAPLTAGVAAELRVASYLVFMAFHQAGKSVSPHAFMTDSSTRGYAMIEGKFDVENVLACVQWKERWRFKEMRESHCNDVDMYDDSMLSASSAEAAAVDFDAELWKGTEHRSPPLSVSKAKKTVHDWYEVEGIVPPPPGLFFENRSWKRVVAGAWAKAAAIHCKEGRVSLMSLERASRQPLCRGCIVVTFGDNLSEILAIESGRARDWELNAICRRAAGIQLFADIDWRRRHVISNANLADHDSRLADMGFIAPGLCYHPSKLLSLLPASCRSEVRPGLHPPALSPDALGADCLDSLGTRFESFKYGNRQGLRQGKGPTSSVGGSAACGDDFLPPGCAPAGQDSGSSDRGRSDWVLSDQLWRQDWVRSDLAHDLSVSEEVDVHRPVKVDGEYMSSSKALSNELAISPPGLAVYDGRARVGIRNRLSAAVAVFDSFPDDNFFPSSSSFRNAEQSYPHSVILDDKLPTSHGNRAQRRSKVFTPAEQVDHSSPSGKVVLELFAGGGRLTGALLQSGLDTACPIEIENGAHFDLLDRRVFRRICRWIRCGHVWAVWLGTPCTPWSCARRATEIEPEHISKGRQCAEITAKLIRLCNASGVYWVLENPKSSKLWSWDPIAKLCAESAVHIAFLPFCAFGTSYQKWTCLKGTLPGLSSLSRECRCTVNHEILCGLAVFLTPDNRKQRIWKTKLAGQYPPQFCREVSRLFRKAAFSCGVSVQHGQGRFSKRWEQGLAEAIGGGCQPLGPPCCPKRTQCEWASAVGFELEGDSRIRRKQALEKLARLQRPAPARTEGNQPQHSSKFTGSQEPRQSRLSPSKNEKAKHFEKLLERVPSVPELHCSAIAPRRQPCGQGTFQRDHQSILQRGRLLGVQKYGVRHRPSPQIGSESRFANGHHGFGKLCSALPAKAEGSADMGTSSHPGKLGGHRMAVPGRRRGGCFNPGPVRSVQPADGAVKHEAKLGGSRTKRRALCNTLPGLSRSHVENSQPRRYKRRRHQRPKPCQAGVAGAAQAEVRRRSPLQSFLPSVSKVDSEISSGLQIPQDAPT